jgi:heavy metal sensor kinase
MRLTWWYAGVLALVLISFAVSTYLFLSYTINRQTNETLREISRTFADVVKREQADEDEKTADDFDAINEAVDDLNFRNYRIFVFDRRQKLIAPTNLTPNEANLSGESLARLQNDFSDELQDSAFSIIEENGVGFRVFADKLILDQENFSVSVSHSLNENEKLLARFRNVLFVSVPLAILLASFGGYFLARKSLSPVVAMSETASNIGAKNLHERLPIENERDELGKLAQVFNRLLKRLDESFSQQKRFMADASHELRTPIAIVRGETEVALSKNERTATDYRESLSIVQAESKRMSRLVEDLFTLARADAGQILLVKTQFYLDELLQDCVRAVKSLAEKRDVRLALEAEMEMPFHADEEFVRRLFLNLLDNAIKFTPPKGSVIIRAEISDNSYLITVSDTGKGISTEDKAHIFERFYRADKARSRDENESGAGLGLSIALWISEVHDGTLRLQNSDADGSTFLVKFPVK